MRAILVNDMTIEYCSACRGIWFDRGVFAQVAQAYSGVQGNGEAKDLSALVVQNDIDDTKRRIELTYGEGVACPVDGTPTLRFVYAGDSRVILERCPHCEGIWFDGDELVRIAEYLRPDLMKDALDTLAFEHIKEEERMKQEASRIISLLASPSGMLLLLVEFVSELIMNWRNSQKSLSRNDFRASLPGDDTPL